MEKVIKIKDNNTFFKGFLRNDDTGEEVVFTTLEQSRGKVFKADCETLVDTVAKLIIVGIGAYIETV